MKRGSGSGVLASPHPAKGIVQMIAISIHTLLISTATRCHINWR
ncbi:hypothetical protein ACNKHU_00035 [Shigella flexneri]